MAHELQILDAELAGSIEVDMTFLKDNNLIELQAPSEWSKPGTKDKYYAVEFDLVMIVDGRNLRYEARWPPTLKDQPPPEQQTTVKAHQISIAANFRPGTA